MSALLKNRLITLFLIVLITPGCRKDPPVVIDPPNDEPGCPEALCHDLPDDGGIGFNYIVQGPQYLRPCFNPNNNDEFVYTRVGQAASPELVKFNLVTKQETVLLNPMSGSNVEWGKQGWIIFVYTGGTVWKIFEDGGGLQQITSFTGNNPKFASDGDRFILTGGSSGVNSAYMPIVDLSGVIIDSIKQEFDSVIFTGAPFYALDQKFHNGYFYYSDHTFYPNNTNGICKLTDNTEITKLNSYPYLNSHIDLDASGETIIYSVFWHGLYKIDLNTLQTTKIKLGCQTRYYKHLSISPNGNKVLVEKVICTPINNFDIDEKHEIWLIDLKGCGEKRILGQ